MFPSSVSQASTSQSLGGFSGNGFQGRSSDPFSQIIGTNQPKQSTGVGGWDADLPNIGGIDINKPK